MSNDTRNRLITALGLVALVLLSANIVTAVAHFTSHRHDRHFVQHERKLCRNKVEARVHTEANTLPIEARIETRIEAEQARALAELEAALARIEAERAAIEMAQLQNLDQEQFRLEAERAQVEAQYERMMADLDRERAQREHEHTR